jgi:phenylpyruvate tautomerase PptA (4-oxalocrotonate tautomerase family)
MPLYTVITQAGVLNGEAKATLAGELTSFHSEYAGVPKNWVHIVFQDYALHRRGSGGNSCAHASCPHRPIAGIQAGSIEAPLGIVAGRDRMRPMTRS